MRLTYLIGQPGSGKSSLVRELTSACLRGEQKMGGVPVVLYGVDLMAPPLAAEIGRRRDDFSGTDALSMSVLPRALDALKLLAMVPREVFAEGDRLATLNFLDPARTAGWDVTLVHLRTTDEVAARRRAARGSTQNETWLRGRATKTKRLASRARDAGFRVETLDGDLPLDEVAWAARALPVFDRLP